MLIVLIGLGTWQVQRLHWKEAVLAEIAAAEAADPIPLPPSPSPYTKVVVTGEFQYDRTAQYGSTVRDLARGTAIGSDQIVPLLRADGPPVLVDRGWIPDKRISPLDSPGGTVSVTGYIRPPSVSAWFNAPDNPAERLFYSMDPVAIGAALGIGHPAPFVLVALGRDIPGVYPAPALSLPRPPNNHLSYVVTWYGLAAALLAVFAVYARKVLRA